MRQLHPHTNFTVFILFFGISLLEAVRTGSWVIALFWFAIALFFLWADQRGRPGTTPHA